MLNFADEPGEGGGGLDEESVKPRPQGVFVRTVGSRSWKICVLSSTIAAADGGGWISRAVGGIIWKR